MTTEAEPPEIEELEQTLAWRLRLLDADPDDAPSAAAVRVLDALADDLRRNDHASLRTELRSICHWLAECDLISDYAEMAGGYRARIGVSEHPADGAAYLTGMLAIARGLV